MAAAGVARYLLAGHVVAFVLAALALAGVAWVVSVATEEVGAHIGPARTGLLQATLGNLPEFFVVLFALRAKELVVAQTAIVGAILVNSLLVLGLVILAGAARASDGVMRFGRRLPNDTATLMMLSSFIIVLVALASGSHDLAAQHLKAISVAAAIAILAVYGVWVRDQLGLDRVSDRARGGGTGLRWALSSLAAGALASAFVSDWFVHALRPATHTLGISRAFAGLVIVAIAGNAVEHAVGVVLAARGRSDLAISVVKGSIAQLVAFLYPALVLVSLLTATTLTFKLGPVYAGALALCGVIVWQITGDGEATAFEGIALVAAFVILAVVAAYQG